MGYDDWKTIAPEDERPSYRVSASRPKPDALTRLDAALARLSPADETADTKQALCDDAFQRAVRR